MNPYGRFELDMNHRLDLAQALTVPTSRAAPGLEALWQTPHGRAGSAS